MVSSKKYDSLMGRSIYICNLSFAHEFLGFDKVLRLCERILHDNWHIPVPFVFPTVAIVVFFLFFILDTPRRILGRIFVSPLNVLYGVIDSAYQRILSRIEHRVY